MKLTIYGWLPEWSLMARYLEGQGDQPIDTLHAHIDKPTDVPPMVTTVYGPWPFDPAALAELLRHVPEGHKHVVVQAPQRRATDLRPCQRPNHLEYSASVDNKIFIHLSQSSPTAPYEVKLT